MLLCESSVRTSSSSVELVLHTIDTAINLILDTSDESKQHSKEVLDNEYNGGDIGSKSDERKNPNNM